VLDGVYQCDSESEPVFVEVQAPTDEVLRAVLHKIITRTMKLLTRRGVLVREQGQTYMTDDSSDSDEACVLRPLQAAACTYRIAFGPGAGQKALTARGAMPRDADFKQTLCATSTASACTTPCAVLPMIAGAGAAVPLHFLAVPGPGQRARANQRGWASRA
jgi:hypothetical protein